MNTEQEFPKMIRVPARLYTFYRDGFRRMTLGRTLWKIIIIKLIVMFAVLKLFFFPDFLSTEFVNDQQRADHVFQQMVDAAKTN